MNNKILELWEQSADRFPHDIKTNPERFAELIVRECLEACSRANEVRHIVPPTQQQVVLSCMDEIERHFGIKE
jgi:hypothetical protein